MNFSPMFLFAPCLSVLSSMVLLSWRAKRKQSKEIGQTVEIISCTLLPLSVLFGVIFYIIFLNQTGN